MCARGGEGESVCARGVCAKGECVCAKGVFAQGGVKGGSVRTRWGGRGRVCVCKGGVCKGSVEWGCRKGSVCARGCARGMCMGCAEGESVFVQRGGVQAGCVHKGPRLCEWVCAHGRCAKGTAGARGYALGVHAWGRARGRVSVQRGCARGVRVCAQMGCAKESMCMQGECGCARVCVQQECLCKGEAFECARRGE